VQFSIATTLASITFFIVCVQIDPSGDEIGQDSKAMAIVPILGHGC